jgi:hypothetical protein
LQTPLSFVFFASRFAGQTLARILVNLAPPGATQCAIVMTMAGIVMLNSMPLARSARTMGKAAWNYWLNP